MSTLTKAGIVDYIYERTDKNRAEIKDLVESILEIMKSAIKKDHALLISGFGKFEPTTNEHERDAIPRPARPSPCPRARCACSGCPASSAQNLIRLKHEPFRVIRVQFFKCIPGRDLVRECTCLCAVQPVIGSYQPGALVAV